MPFDPAVAADRLADLARRPPASPHGWPAGAPHGELVRSPAALRVATLAAADGLFLFHHELRHHAELPDDWVPAERADLADPPAWADGVLPERKYQQFRHDLPIGGFNPGHRAKWTTHELCHGLVGFAWRPDATPFFHATAGRLAELLPVTLWYFLDEAFLRRCPVHTDEGALFRAFCPDCDAVAAPRLDDSDAARRLADGRRFLDRELAAIARTRRLGRPVPHVWATLDLCSDGVAYAGAHAARLSSEAFRRFAALFLVDDGGVVSSLDALEARVVAVAAALAGGDDPPPLAPTPAHGRARWTLQDVGWRLLSVWHDTGGACADALFGVIERLAAAVPATRDPDEDATAVTAAALRRALSDYEALAEEWTLPPTDDVAAVGYPLIDDHGVAWSSLEDGVRSAAPLAAARLGERFAGEVRAFAAADRPRRAPLPLRWSEHLDHAVGGAIADLARYEAALRTAAPADADALALGPDGDGDAVRLAGGMRVWRFSIDVVDWADALDAGDEPEPEARDTALVIGADPLGDRVVLDVSPPTADALVALGDGGQLDIAPDEAQALRRLRALVPARWAEVTG